MSETETIDPRYRGLDTWSDARHPRRLPRTGRRGRSPRCGRRCRRSPPRRGAIAARIEPDGRLIYAGAGSSGRQAALDGMELGATFSWPAERIAFVLAEGTVLIPASSGTDEDDTAHARAAISALEPRRRRLRHRRRGERHDAVHAVPRRKRRRRPARWSSPSPTIPTRRSSDTPTIRSCSTPAPR